MKKTIYLLTGLLLASLILIACGGNDANSNASENNEEEVTLTFWNRYAELRDGLESFIAGFEEEHPHITIDWQEIPGGEAETQIRTALSEDDLPDLFTDTMAIKELVDLGAIKNLDEIFTDEVRDQFHAGTWYENGTTIEGSVYSFPMMSPRSKAMMMFYNLDVLEDLGLTEDDVPTDWEELTEVGNRILAESDGGISPLMWNNPGWANAQLVQMIGTAITPETPWYYNLKEGVPNLNSQGNVESAQFLKQLLDDGIMSDESVEIGLGTAIANFAVGNSAFLFSGDWVGGQLINDNDFENWEVAPVPTKTGGSYFYPAGSEATGIHVAENTEHWEEVKLFLEYALENYYKEVLVDTGAGLPAKMDVEGTPPYEQYNSILELQEELTLPVPRPEELNQEIVQFDRDLSGKLEVGGIGDAIVGYLTNNIDDIEEELSEINEAYTEAFFDTLEEYPDLSQDDFSFPNWDTNEPFTEEDYEELR
ncbi:ABC transporter substrate-binding protein [Salipaludibacillus sp. HK11]|uniref:ABC transporter substrate-binding protein n=1 Tax=Salipaludibacillus sp. HK11 TaxID=3394320 RepID=UPI0039FC0765